jgi:Flp pilus assembly pilin Flp
VRAETVVEYAMMLGLIALVVVAGVLIFGDWLNPWFSALASRITTVGMP